MLIIFGVIQSRFLVKINNFGLGRLRAQIPGSGHPRFPPLDPLDSRILLPYRKRSFCLSFSYLNQQIRAWAPLGPDSTLVPPCGLAATSVEQPRFQIKSYMYKEGAGREGSSGMRVCNSQYGHPGFLLNPKP